MLRVGGGADPPQKGALFGVIFEHAQIRFLLTIVCVYKLYLLNYIYLPAVDVLNLIR